MMIMIMVIRLIDLVKNDKAEQPIEKDFTWPLLLPLLSYPISVRLRMSMDMKK